jgi:charged multivesicular body protein 7
MNPAGTSRSHLYDLPTFKEASTSRLKFLYSDFSRQKQSNPASFSSNVEWWRRTLETLVLKGWLSQNPTAQANPDRLVFHAIGPQVTEQFRVEGVGKPLGLSAVIVSTLNS